MPSPENGDRFGHYRKSGDGSTAPSEFLDGKPLGQVGAVLKWTLEQKSENLAETEIRIGTSGWHYKHWVGKYYPPRLSPREMLPFYASEFATVEINNSFYRLPEEATFRHWKEQVPPDFVFAVKVSRYITHIKRLRDPKGSINLLLERAAPLGKSLGPILFQLPPRWKLNLERLSDFLNVVPKPLQVAIEFRDRTWCVKEVYKLLHEHGVAICFHDWGGEQWPEEPTADFAYIRFHGAGQRYGGNYSNEALTQWAEKIQSWKPRLNKIYAYFNNDAQGYALYNARSLREMLGFDERQHEVRAA